MRMHAVVDMIGCDKKLIGDIYHSGFGVAQRKRGGPISKWWDTLRSQDRNLAPKFCRHVMACSIKRFEGFSCSNSDVQVNTMMAEFSWSKGM